MKKLKTLATIAGVGGMVTSLTGYTLHGILQNRVRDSPVYKETMKIINNHSEALNLLGKPIKSKTVDVKNSNNILSLKMSSLELPIYGPKNSGVLYVWADRISEEDPWNIFKLELKIQDEINSKVIIIDKHPVLLEVDSNKNVMP